MEVIPGILEKDWAEIEKKLEAARSFSKAIHIDLIDGKFAQNTTFLDPKPFARYAHDLVLELHMMVDNPIQYLKPFADAGFKRFIGHVEKMELVEEFIAEGEILGEVGLAIDGPTDISMLDSVNLEDLDSVLIYTCEKVGFAGPPFVPERLEKVKKLKEKISDQVLSPEFRIEVDGGINDKTIVQARDAGANRFVATSFIWNSQDPKAAYENLTSIIA
jgi:ribulose-phosphate 3-epimerase